MADSATDSALPGDLPDLPDGWTYSPLASLVDKSRGICYGIVQPGSHAEGGVPIVRVNNIRDGRVVTDNVMRVSGEIEAKYKRSRLRGGEVVISLVGSLGEAAIVPSDLSGWNVARAVGVLPVVENVGARWVQLCLRSDLIQHYIRTWATTTVQATFNLRDAARLPIPMPPDKERQAIACILGSLDDRIELNLRMNETLESIARALYQAWFVDFEPVRAKAEGRDTGLPKTIADLFPDRLVDSEVGEIPDGWGVGTFGDVATQVRESVNPQESPDTLFRHFSIPAYDEGRWPNLEVGESIKSVKSRVPAGAVLLSKLNPEIERVWLVDVQADDRAICSTEFIVLVPRAPFGRSYVYCLSRSLPFRQGLEGLVTGTSKSHQRARVGAVLALPIVRPPDALLRRFESVAESLLARSLISRRVAHTLAALRDALLPKLISGEIRVRDAERLIGETV